ncbi:MAG: citrate/2-methylcitrate synthase [Treponemataceae bacterium]|nr:MAG: citrate/2-methylcitrate synthase [Treponemataceae bacterium]
MHNYKDDVTTEKLSLLAQINDPIDPSLYQKYDVKRGLRYDDGHGVLVGLTRIGDVIGYEVQGDTRVAIPGKLLYRGYNVEDIVRDTVQKGEFGFEQTAYLLLFGQLPRAEELTEFNRFLRSRRKLPGHFAEDTILKSPSSDVMNKLARTILASYAYDRFPEDVSIKNVMRQCIELIGRLPVMAAYALQAKKHYYDGKSMYMHNPDPKLSTAENFLRLIRPDKSFTRLEAQILDLCLILHAEHGGGNNSTFSVHVISSADTDTYSAMAAAIGSLKGRRHGGANIQVIQMMEDIKKHVYDWKDEGEVRRYLQKILHKEAFDKTGLIYGQGHAIYTISDPRAILLKERAVELAKTTGYADELELYKLIERLAPEEIAAIRPLAKKVCTNVDFYSGFIYTMLGIPQELFTPLFAISRIAGWSAHRMEEIVAGGRIYRPAFKNVGEERTYIPFAERT